MKTIISKGIGSQSAAYKKALREFLARRDDGPIYAEFGAPSQTSLTVEGLETVNPDRVCCKLSVAEDKEDQILFNVEPCGPYGKILEGLLDGQPTSMSISSRLVTQTMTGAIKGITAIDIIPSDWLSPYTADIKEV